MTRSIADLGVPDIDAAKRFSTDDLGLSAEELDMGWVAPSTSPDTGANLSLVTRDATAPEDPVISGLTGRLGYEIVDPITTEAWG